MNNRLKQIIFDKLYQDLKHLEIIPYEGSIWFIDRKNEYWYLEYEKSGELWWRWQFFVNFFKLFSMERNEYEPIISEWVVEVLNCNVIRPSMRFYNGGRIVGEVLNCNVIRPKWRCIPEYYSVDNVLNCNVIRPNSCAGYSLYRVENALNCNVKTPTGVGFQKHLMVEEVLYHKNN